MAPTGEPKPREKATLDTPQALADNFTDEMDAIDVDDNKLWYGLDKKRNATVETERTLVEESAAAILSQIYYLHVTGHGGRIDRTTLDDVTEQAKIYLRERQRSLGKIFRAGKRANAATEAQEVQKHKRNLMREFQNVYMNFAEWYFGLRKVRTFAGKNIEEVVAQMRGNFEETMGGKYGGPHIASQAWGDEFAVRSGANPNPQKDPRTGSVAGAVHPQRVRGGRGDGNR